MRTLALVFLTTGATMTKNLKTTLLGSAVVLASAASTSTLAAEPQFYMEANFGKSKISDVNTKPYNGNIGSDTWNASASIDYNSPTYWGFEIGANKLGSLPLRVGFAYTTLKAKFEQANLSGSATIGGQNYNANIPITRADLAAAGLDFDNRVTIYGANAYYDFDTKSALRPYLGFGVGLADISNAKDNEFTYSLHAGLNYDISKATYIGARVGWYRISGPTDELGIAYQDIKTTNYGVTLGYRY
jgi:opacity protein-like surface antigen